MHTSTDRAFAALLLGMLMAQLDGNLVVAALPILGAELGEPAAVAGVTAAYLLTVTVSTPVHGRLGDLFGRRAVFLGSLALFAIGSALCALAPSMGALVAARAVQGVGGGGLVVSAVTALGEMFDAADRVRRQVWVSGVFAVSALAGPPVGAVLAAGPGWRWAFLVNLPICAVTAALGRGLPRRRAGGARGFDVAGTVLVAVGGSGLVLLGSSSALATGPWAVPVVVVVVVAALLFVRVEQRVASPLIPPRLFVASVSTTDISDADTAYTSRRHSFGRTVAATGLSGLALFGGFTFVPLAVTAGTGADAGTVGTLLVALTGGQLVVVSVFAVLARRWSRMAPWGRAGLLLGAVGNGLLAALPMLGPSGLGFAVVGMALVGAGLGLCLQAYTLLGQAMAPADAFGAAMATLTFARQLGGAVGAAGLGWLLLALPPGPFGPGIVLGVAAATLLAALAVAPRTSDERLDARQ